MIIILFEYIHPYMMTSKVELVHISRDIFVRTHEKLFLPFLSVALFKAVAPSKEK